MGQAIGYFEQNKAGELVGKILTGSTQMKAKIIPNTQKDKDNQPDFRIFSSTGFDLGGIWTRKAKSTGAECLSATIRAPELGGNPVYANLVPVKKSKGKHVLIWNS